MHKKETENKGVVKIIESTSPCLNIAAIRECTEVEGPGKRFAVWMQGCLKHCHGCSNPHMHDPTLARVIMAPSELVEKIRRAHQEHGITGLTLLGGEPFLQAGPLSIVAEEVRKMGLSILAFTGYTLGELEEFGQNGNIGVTRLLQNVDLLIDGPFIMEEPDFERNWAGSRNQCFHYLTDRFPRGIEFEPEYGRAMEIIINPDGFIEANGWPFLLELSGTGRIDCFSGQYYNQPAMHQGYE